MVHLIKDENGYPIGWEMIPTNDQDRDVYATVRDLQFFGFNGTRIVYDGITLIDEEKGKSIENLKSVRWIQDQHKK